LLNDRIGTPVKPQAPYFCRQLNFIMKHIILSLLIVTITTAAFAQPGKVIADKIVAVVGDKLILKSDLDNSLADMQRQGAEIPANGRCLTLEQAMGIKALVLQAEKDSLPVPEEKIETDIDNQIRYFINAYGSKDELERIAGKTIYQIKEDFKQGFRDRELASAMRNKIVEGIKITPNETKAYFDQIPKDSLAFYESEVQIGEIVIYPKASRDAEEYAIEQLKEYRTQIESGRKDFKTLATIYSEDPAAKENAGQYEINRNQKDLDPTWLAKAYTLKEGQISTPFKTKFGYHIIQLVSRAGDDAVVRHILKIPQITATEITEVNNKLDSVRAKLLTGIFSFGEAVAKYSNDEASKFTGGLRQSKDGDTYLTIDELDANTVALLKSLTVGQYSQPVEYADERGKKGVRFIYLVSRTEPHRENMKDDYNKISLRAIEEKKAAALEKWFTQKIPTYYIMLDEEYKTCEEMQKWINPAGASAKN
jgi:peptidyl-prolyl cis-trans isomerase SurA